MCNKKVLSLIIIVLLLITNSSVAFSAGAGAVAAPGSGAADTSKFEAAIAAAVQKAFAEQAESLGPEVLNMAEPQIEALKSSLEGFINTQKEKLDKLSTSPSNIIQDMSLPSKEVIDSIPPQGLEEAKSRAKKAAGESINKQFEMTSGMIKEQVNKLIGDSLPQIRASVKPAMQNLILSIHNFIEERISESIDQKIMAEIPDLETLIPESMEDLTPQQIADKLENKLRPGIESVVRPVMEEKLKTAMETAISERVEKPITDAMTPKIVNLETTAYDSVVNQIPEYVKKLVPDEFVLSVVHENIEKLKASLPQMIADEQAAIRTAMKQDVDKEIDGMVKVYINGKRYTKDIKTKMTKSKVLDIDFTSLASMLGAKVKYTYAKKQVTFIKGKNTVVLTMNSYIVLVNGKKVKIAEPPVLDGKQPLIPAEILSKLLGEDFEWQSDWRMAVIE